MEAITQPKFIMLCTDKGSMVQAQYCSEWTELWYGTLVRFCCSEMIEPELWEFIILFKYLLLTGLQIRHKWEPTLKVPFAVRRHIYHNDNYRNSPGGETESDIYRPTHKR